MVHILSCAARATKTQSLSRTEKHDDTCTPLKARARTVRKQAHLLSKLAHFNSHSNISTSAKFFHTLPQSQKDKIPRSASRSETEKRSCGNTTSTTQLLDLRREHLHDLLHFLRGSTAPLQPSPSRHAELPRRQAAPRCARKKALLASVLDLLKDLSHDLSHKRDQPRNSNDLLHDLGNWHIHSPLHDSY